MDFQKILDLTVDWFLSSGLRILVIIIIAIIAMTLAKMLANRILAPLKEGSRGIEAKKRADTLGAIITYVLSVAVISVAIVVILSEFGVQIGPILAAAGVVGLAVGFGAQSLVQDVISGFFILLQDEVRVGDVVNVGGKGGLVEQVNLKMVVLRDLSGNVHYIRNGLIDVVTNMTKDYSFYLFNIGVAYREKYDDVVAVVKEIDEGMRNDDDFKDDILEPIEILGLDEFGDSAITIKARIKTKPIKQWRVGREFNRRMKMAFDEKDIEIPFPHLTMYMGMDKDGSAPPMNIRMEGEEPKIPQTEEKKSA